MTVPVTLEEAYDLLADECLDEGRLGHEHCAWCSAIATVEGELRASHKQVKALRNAMLQLNDWLSDSGVGEVLPEKIRRACGRSLKGTFDRDTGDEG